MPARNGQCINLGLCHKADSKELLTIPEGKDFFCPECGKPLRPAGALPRKLPLSLVFGIATGLVLTVLGYFLWARSHSSGIGSASASSGTVVLRISGSNTIGAALGPALAEEFLRERQGATSVKTVRGDKEFCRANPFPRPSKFTRMVRPQHSKI